MALDQISWKSHKKHSALEYYIREIDPNQDLTRAAFTNRAIVEAASQRDWKIISDELAALKIPDVSPPTAMQVKIDETNIDKIGLIKKSIAKSLGLEIVQVQYLIQLVWMNYLRSLKRIVEQVGNSKRSGSEITGPEMVKRLVQLLLLNRETDEEVIEKIKAILCEWEA